MSPYAITKNESQWRSPHGSRSAAQERFHRSEQRTGEYGSEPIARDVMLYDESYNAGNRRRPLTLVRLVANWDIYNNIKDSITRNGSEAA